MNSVRVYRDVIEGSESFTVYNNNECIGTFLGDEDGFQKLVDRAEEITEGLIEG
jgi:hypothetical protein